MTSRLRASNSSQGLNSVATSSGHSSTSAAPVQNTRPSQAGSRGRTCAATAAAGGGRPLSSAVHHHRGWRGGRLSAVGHLRCGRAMRVRPRAARTAASSSGRRHLRGGQVEGDARRRAGPTMRGNCASAASTWCRLVDQRGAALAGARPPAWPGPGARVSGRATTAARRPATAAPAPAARAPGRHAGARRPTAGRHARTACRRGRSAPALSCAAGMSAG